MGIILSRIQSSDSEGVIPQFVGQDDNNSTMLNPSPLIWASKAVRIAFLA